MIDADKIRTFIDYRGGIAWVRDHHNRCVLAGISVDSTEEELIEAEKLKFKRWAAEKVGLDETATWAEIFDARRKGKL